MRFAAIDFETANRGADSACAVGVVIAGDGRIVHRETQLICRHLGIPLNHHDPASDADACTRIVLAAEEAGWHP